MGSWYGRKAFRPNFVSKVQPFSWLLIAWPSPKHNLHTVWVVLMMASNGWLNSTCRLLMFHLVRAVAETALSSMEFHKKSTPVTQPSQVLICRSKIILPLGVITTMLLNSLLDILFSHESSHVREKRFALPKDITSQAIEYGPVHLRSLDVLLLVACPSS